MKMKLFSVICIILLLASCSHPSLPAEDSAAALTPAGTPTAESAKTETSPSPSPTPKATASPTPEPTPFERKDVMAEPKIMVYKSKRMLYVYDGDTLCAKIKIALGTSPEGHKQKEGDGKTPEGVYYICTRNDHSRFYLSLGLSYPNAEDARAGLDAGLISQSEYEGIKEAMEAGGRPSWSTALGGEIMIHGAGTASDWTAGCIAAENSDMDYLWENCSVGTPVEILP